MDRKRFWKRRKCWLPAFSPFPKMFSKASFLRVVKSQDRVVKSRATFILSTANALSLVLSQNFVVWESGKHIWRTSKFYSDKTEVKVLQCMNFHHALWRGLKCICIKYQLVSYWLIESKLILKWHMNLTL